MFLKDEAFTRPAGFRLAASCVAISLSSLSGGNGVPATIAILDIWVGKVMSFSERTWVPPVRPSRIWIEVFFGCPRTAWRGNWKSCRSIVWRCQNRTYWKSCRELLNQPFEVCRLWTFMNNNVAPTQTSQIEKNPSSIMQFILRVVKMLQSLFTLTDSWFQVSGVHVDVAWSARCFDVWAFFWLGCYTTHRYGELKGITGAAVVHSCSSFLELIYSIL